MSIHSNPELPIVTLYTTLEQFEELHRAHDRVRSTSTTVTVNKEALGRVLMDHSQLVDAVRKGGRVKVHE